MLAPFAPFIAEEIFLNINVYNRQRKSSIHLSNWPPVKAYEALYKDNKYLVSEMALVRKIAELGHAQRKQAKIPIRQPLSSIKVKFIRKEPGRELLQLIKDELNIKKVIWDLDKKSTEPEVLLITKLTPKLKEEGKTRELIRKIQIERRKMGLGLQDKIKVKSDWLPIDENNLVRLKRKTLIKEVKKGSFKVTKI
jgi:isoleucyl-tRNA synthetase